MKTRSSTEDAPGRSGRTYEDAALGDENQGRAAKAGRRLP